MKGADYLRTNTVVFDHLFGDEERGLDAAAASDRLSLFYWQDDLLGFSFGVYLFWERDI
jgi:hypothetical protein